MSDVDEKMFLEAETAFGLNLLSHAPINESLVFSPLSIAIALAMVHAGAIGETKTQITQAICKGATDDQLTSHYKSLSASFLNASNGVQVNMANRMFIKNGFPVKQTYLKTIQKDFKASAQNLDFSNGVAAAKIVNHFVSETTKEKITEIVQPDQFQDAVAFLINALYLKADWADKFYSGSTNNATFYSSEGIEKQIPFMHDFDVHRDYTETDEVQVLSLKYTDNSYAFTIFLPKEKFGLAKFRANLTASKLQGLLGSLKNTFVSVAIPKIKIEQQLELKSMLEALGVTQMFSDNANLSGIADNIKVSDATHKAVIQVDEEGTVAAATTQFKIVPKMGRITRPIPVTADHPFLFVIANDKHPVFIGTLY